VVKLDGIKVRSAAFESNYEEFSKLNREEGYVEFVSWIALPGVQTALQSTGRKWEMNNAIWWQGGDDSIPHKLFP
jgi:hypothetical protein